MIIFLSYYHDSQMTCWTPNKWAEQIQLAGKCKFFSLYTIVIFIPLISFILSSLIILIETWSSEWVPEWLPLQIWLLVFFLLETLYLIKCIIVTFYRTTEIGSKVIFYGVLIHQGLLLIWTIIGAIASFKYIEFPEERPLYIIVLSIICVQWASIFLVSLHYCGHVVKV